MPCHESHTYGPGLDEHLGAEMEQMMEDAEQAQQEADHRRDVEQDREMVTDDPPPEDILRAEQENTERGTNTTSEPSCPVVVHEESDWPKDSQRRLDAEHRGSEVVQAVGLGLPYVHGVEQHRVLDYNYWNANGVGVCIVAKEGEVADWAAYIGADGGWRTEECVEWTIRHGCKLSRNQAHRWFPNLPIEAYRE